MRKESSTQTEQLSVRGTKAELRTRVGRRELVEAPPPPPPPQYFFAGRFKAIFLFWFFGDFRCGVLLFILILDLYINIKIGKNRYLMLD